MPEQPETPRTGEKLSKPMPKNYRTVVLDNGEEGLEVTEGKAKILSRKKNEVFYNPIQNFNRDLSVLCVLAYGEQFMAEKEKKAAAKKNKKLKTKVVASSAVKEDDEEPALVGNGKGAEVDESMLPPVEPPQIERRQEESEEVNPDANTTQSSGPPTDSQQPNQRHKRFAVLDALSATGLRALRYAHEVPFCTQVTANDLSPSAIKLIETNIEYNNLSGKITASANNAMVHMYASPGKYDAIDLDPYGTAVPFLDSAIQALSDGGILACTCTDAGVWASTGYSEKCFALYGGTPLKGEYCHEAGLRLILYAIAQSAARYGLSIEPLLSLSVDFYARVFVRIKKSPAQVKFLSSRSMIVYVCDSGCGSWITNPIGKATEETNKSGKGTFWKFSRERVARRLGENGKCPDCGFTLHIAGPMYAGPLHQKEFVNNVLGMLPSLDPEVYTTIPRITGMLETAASELDTHFFVDPTRLAKTVHMGAPPFAAVRGALLHLGYEVSRTHCKASAIKTNAPWPVMWEIARQWRKQERGDSLDNVKEGSPGYKIMTSKISAEDIYGGLPNGQKTGDIEIVFDTELGKVEEKQKGTVRYQPNPTDNWGPMARAGKRPVEEVEGTNGRETKRQR